MQPEAFNRVNDLYKLIQVNPWNGVMIDFHHPLPRDFIALLARERTVGRLELDARALADRPRELI